MPQPSPSATDIDRWFARTARRGNRSVSLYSSIMTGRILAYFGYRLRYALLMDTTRFVIHVAEFLIILTSLGGLAAFTVMLLRMGSLIVSGGWWGLLEVMRERLREFAVAEDRDAIEREIGGWLALSAVAAIVVAVGGGIALAVLLPSDGDRVGHLYAYLVLLELALRLPVRVLHSGMFATRRIYRPLWSMFAPTGIQLLVITAGVFLYPAGAIVVAIIAANAISIWITVHYTVRAYRLNGLWPRYSPSGRGRLLPSVPLGRSLQAAVAGLGLRLDAVLVLAIVGIYGTTTRSFDLTAGFAGWRDVDVFGFFYLALPLFRGAYDATSVFYFDFVRLRRIPALRQFRVSFFHRLLWTTPVLATFFWLLAVALGLFVLPGIPFTFLLALLPLFIVRSVIGAYQIRMFAEGQFSALIATIALLGALLWLVWIDVNPASDLVQITAAMIAILVVHINVQHLRDRNHALPTLLSLRDWTYALSRERVPLRVGRLVIPGWIDSRQRGTAVRLIRESLDGQGYFAFRSSTSLIFFQRVTDDDQPHLALQTATGGAVNRVQMLPGGLRSGAEALDRAVDATWLPPSAETPTAGSTGDLVTAFRALYPDGVVVDLDTGAGRDDARTLDPTVLSALLPTVMKTLDTGTVVTSVAGRSVTPVFHRGKLRLVCVLPPDAGPEQLRRWRHTVSTWHAFGRVTEGAAHAGAH